MLSYEQFVIELEKRIRHLDKGTIRFLWESYTADPENSKKNIQGLNWLNTYIRPLDDEERQASIIRANANKP